MRYVLFVLAAAVLFGTTGTSQAFAPSGAASLSIGAARLGFGGLILGVVGVVTWLRHPDSRPHLTRGAALAVVTGAAVVLVYQTTFFAGTRQNGVMVGTVIALGSSPVFTGVIEWAVLRQRPTIRWLIATVLAVGGVVALSHTSGPQLRVHPSGVLLSLVAGLCYATLAVATKWLLNHGWRSGDVAEAIMGVGAVPALVLLATTDASWLAQPRGVVVTAWLALVTMVAAYVLMVAGMRGLSAATTTTVGLGETATATVLGIVVLGEAMTAWRAAGVAAIIAGVLVVGLVRRPAPATASSS